MMTDGLPNITRLRKTGHLTQFQKVDWIYVKMYDFVVKKPELANPFCMIPGNGVKWYALGNGCRKLSPKINLILRNFKIGLNVTH